MLSPAKFFAFLKSHAPKKKLHDLVSHGPTLKGNLHTKGAGNFAGELIGDIFAEQELVIFAPAKIEGNLNGLDFSVAGMVHGNIVARLGVRLKQPARVKGNITAYSFESESGVEYNGKLVIGGTEKELALNLKSKR